MNLVKATISVRNTTPKDKIPIPKNRDEAKTEKIYPKPNIMPAILKKGIIIVANVIASPAIRVPI
jgi:hypothetical protein